MNVILFGLKRHERADVVVDGSHDLPDEKRVEEQ